MFPVFLQTEFPSGGTMAGAGQWEDGQTAAVADNLMAGNIPFPQYLATSLRHLEQYLWEENSSISIITKLAHCFVISIFRKANI